MINWSLTPYTSFVESNSPAFLTITRHAKQMQNLVLCSLSPSAWSHAQTTGLVTFSWLFELQSCDIWYTKCVVDHRRQCLRWRSSRFWHSTCSRSDIWSSTWISDLYLVDYHKSWAFSPKRLPLVVKYKFRISDVTWLLLLSYWKCYEQSASHFWSVCGLEL